MDSYITTERQLLKNKYTRILPCWQNKDSQKMAEDLQKNLHTFKSLCPSSTVLILYKVLKTTEMMIFSSGITMWSMNKVYLTLQN